MRARTRSSRHVAAPTPRGVRRWLTDPSGFGLVTFGALVVGVLIELVVSPGAFQPRALSLSDAFLVFLRDVTASTVTLVFLRLVAAVWLRLPFARRHPSIMILTVFVTVLTSLLLFDGLGGVQDATGGAQETVVRTAWWLTAVLLVALTAVNAGREHVAVMTEYRATASALEATLAASEQMVAGERDRVYQRITAAFGQMVETAKSSREITRELEMLAENVLRPLSRSLADSQSLFSPVAPPALEKVSVADRFANLLNRPLMRPGLLSVTIALLVFRQSFSRPAEVVQAGVPPASEVGLGVSVDWESFLVSVAVLFVTSVSVYWSSKGLARLYTDVLPRVRVGVRWLLAMGAVVVVSGTALVSFWLLYALPFVSSVPPPLSAVVLLGIMLPLIAVMAVSTVIEALVRILGENEARAAEYAEQLRGHVARTNVTLVHERRDIARKVHNSVQGAVSAARLTLNRLAEPHPEIFESVTGRIADAVEELLADKPAAGLVSQLDGLEELWAGVCQVTWQMDAAAGDKLDQDAVAASLVGDIIYEGCANAAVHGHATHVRIMVNLVDDATAVNVTVRDNGQLGRAVSAGLGSQILAHVCTTWELARDGDETVLTAVLPLT